MTQRRRCGGPANAALLPHEGETSQGQLSSHHHPRRASFTTTSWADLQRGKSGISFGAFLSSMPCSDGGNLFDEIPLKNHLARKHSVWICMATAPRRGACQRSNLFVWSHSITVV